MFSWSNQPKPIVALSPMADMTDSAFCRIAKQFAAPIVFREMISADGLVYGNKKSLEMAAFHEVERPIIQQLFGSNPDHMAEATRMIDSLYNPDGFDINMGCPVYKITSNFNGAALMKDPILATKIINAMKAVTTKPVSVKIRLGWSDPTESLDFIKIVEAAGADLITIHGRTKEQGYSGVSDWHMIGRAKTMVKIPVLVNGDIHDAKSAKRSLEVSGCDGVLIARGALGNPWIFEQIRNELANQPVINIDLKTRIETVKNHARLHTELYGGENSLVTFRKHLSWYFKGVANVKIWRDQLVKIKTLAELDSILGEILSVKQ